MTEPNKAAPAPTEPELPQPDVLGRVRDVLLCDLDDAREQLAQIREAEKDAKLAAVLKLAQEPMPGLVMEEAWLKKREALFTERMAKIVAATGGEEE